MPWFLLGVILAWSGLAIPTLVTDAAVRTDNPWVLYFIAAAWAIPITCAWLAAELVNFVLPKRILAGDASTRPRRLIAGLASGLLGVGLSVIAMAYVPENMPEALVTGAAGAAGALCIVLLLPRVHKGRCRKCDYDLAGITPAAAGKCPECGLEVMLAS